MGTEKNNAKAVKIAVLVTYIVATLCLLAGLFLPFGGNAAGFSLDNMLFWQLPAALKGIVSSINLPFGAAHFDYGMSASLFGKIPAIDYGAIFALLYLVVAVAALICIVPVILCKAENGASVKVASVIEAVALTVVGIFVYMQLDWFSIVGYGARNWSWSILIALGGTALMLIIQSFITKGGSGVIKFILFLLSLIAVLFTVFNVGQIVTFLTKPLNDLSNLVGLPLGLFKEGDNVKYGLDIFQPFLMNFVFAGEGDKKLLITVLNISVIVAVVLALINVIFDMMGLGKTTNKVLLVLNIVRYALEFVAAIVVLVMVLVLKYTFGIGLIILLVMSLLALIINIIRTVIYDPEKARRKAEEKENKKKEAEEKKAQEEKESEKAKKDDSKPQTAETTAQNTATQSKPVVYNVEPIYNGPVDDFIKKLTNAERIEFAQIFLERRKGNIPNVPDYIVGGQNAKFFSTVFIYYGRIRDLCSDGLMNKLYEQGNMMH